MTDEEKKRIQNYLEESNDVNEIEQEIQAIIEKIETTSELESPVEANSQVQVFSTQESAPLLSKVEETKAFKLTSFFFKPLKNI